MFGVGAENVGAHRTVAGIADAIENIANDRRRVDAVVRRLAHQFVVPGFEREVNRQEKHPQPFDLVDAHTRMLLQARHFVIGHVVDEIRLSRLQRRKPRGILGDFLENDFFDRRLAAPVVVIAGENQIAAALVADKFIGPGANEILINLIAKLVAGLFTQHETVVEPIEKHRVGLLGDKDHRGVVRSLNLADILEVRRLQAAALFVAHLVD